METPALEIIMPAAFKILSWVLGGGAALGAIGASILGILIYRLAKNNRTDLHQLNQTNKDLVYARRDAENYRLTIETLEKQLDAERAALDEAKKALSDARKKLSLRGSSADVAKDINDTLTRLGHIGL